MKTSRWFGLAGSAIALLAASALTPTPAAAQSVSGQQVVRLSAQQAATGGVDFDGFDPLAGPSASTQFYTATVKTPAGANVLYVTMTGTAAGACDALLVLCQVDGAICDPSINSIEADTSELHSAVQCHESVAGYILLGSQGDTALFGEPSIDGAWGEMTVAHTWCIPITKTKKNLHTVALFGAEACGEGCDNTIEQVSVFIDANKVKDDTLACTSFTL
jgi:hypothetical protein